MLDKIDNLRLGEEVLPWGGSYKLVVWYSKEVASITEDLRKAWKSAYLKEGRGLRIISLILLGSCWYHRGLKRDTMNQVSSQKEVDFRVLNKNT